MVKRQQKFLNVMKQHEKLFVLYNKSACAEMRELVQDFLKRTQNLALNWNSEQEVNKILKSVEAVVSFYFNSYWDEVICPEELQYMKKILKEIERLQNEVFQHPRAKLLMEKMGASTKLFDINKSKREIGEPAKRFFQSYKTVYQLLHYIIEEYKELQKNGSVGLTLEQLKEAIVDGTDQEKLEVCKQVLSGTMKVQNEYCLVKTGCCIVEREFKGIIIRNLDDSKIN